MGEQFQMPDGPKPSRRVPIIVGVAVAVLAIVVVVGVVGYLARDRTPRAFVPSKVIDSFPLGDGPFAIAVDHSRNKIYTANYAGKTVSVVDEISHRVSQIQGVTAGPRSAVLDEDAGRLYVGGSAGNTMAIIDTGNDTLIETVKIGEGNTIANDATRHLVFAANNRDGTVARYDPATRSVTTSNRIGSNPYSISVDAGRNLLYVVVADKQRSRVAILDASTLTVTGEIPLELESFESGYDPGTNRLFVANENDRRLTVVDMGKRIVESRIDVGPGTSSIAIDAPHHTVCVVDGKSDVVRVIDSAAGKVLDILRVGHEPTSVFVDSRASRLFVGQLTPSSVTIMA
jgi:DNA-binding beta-propeller fold protein YncE